MMLLRPLLFLASFCLALPAQEVSDIMIGTWNIEFLGADPKFRRDTPPRSKADLLAIGEKIQDLGVSLLAVQEICGQEPLDEVARATGPSWRAILGTTGKWTDGKTQQGVGFLFDSNVLDCLHAEELSNFPSQRDELSVFHRKPVTAILKHRATGCDFRIVVVHLKAGRKARDLAKRKAEAKTLREWVGKLAEDPKEDRDLIILGDFNSTYGDDPEVILEDGGVMQYLEQQQPTPTIMHFDTPIDQLCATVDFRELQRNSMQSHAVSSSDAKLAFRKTYSDHFPVTVRMTPLADDDPDATFWRGPAGQRLPPSRRPTQQTPLDVVRVSGGAVRAWPPSVGEMITVQLKGATTPMRAKLLQKLSADRHDSWLVIEFQGDWQAMPLSNVLWIRPGS
jgi:endonuclease/exonuclease/phosphatase family metal-dependent hydrolase